MQLKSFVKDSGKNVIVGISEIWLTAEHITSLWNIAPNTHELYGSDSGAINSKKEEGGVMFFAPLKHAPKDSKNLKLFDQSRTTNCALTVGAISETSAVLKCF